MSIRRAASCTQPLQERAVPRGARMVSMRVTSAGKPGPAPILTHREKRGSAPDPLLDCAAAP
jgi:hypothetical protein